MKAFEELYARAEAAGKAAAAARAVRPMVVQWREGAIVRQEVVDSGVCGFAWVAFAGNTAFGRWAKQAKGASKHYPKGLTFWISDYGQSMERKEAHAYAMAAVLKEGGIDAHADSRMD